MFLLSPSGHRNSLNGVEDPNCEQETPRRKSQRKDRGVLCLSGLSGNKGQMCRIGLEKLQRMLFLNAPCEQHRRFPGLWGSTCNQGNSFSLCTGTCEENPEAFKKHYPFIFLLNLGAFTEPTSRCSRLLSSEVG